MNDALRSLLKQLRLSGLLRAWKCVCTRLWVMDSATPSFWRWCSRTNWLSGPTGSYSASRRVQFRDLKPLDSFDWSFNSSIK